MMKKKIIEMIENIGDKKKLRVIYFFIKNLC